MLKTLTKSCANRALRKFFEHADVNTYTYDHLLLGSDFLMQQKFLLQKILLCVATLLLLFGSAFSNARAEVNTTVILDSNAPSQIYTVENAPTLHTIFYSALAHLRANSGTNVADAFDELITARDREGYANLPQYSQTLLEYASLIDARGDTETATATINIALTLSPTDARVYTHAASLYAITGWPVALNTFSRGLVLAIRYPSLVFSFLLNVLILTLMAGTSATFLVVVLQLTKHCEAVLGVVRKFSGYRLELVAASTIVAFVLVVPLALGLLASILVGSLLLALSVKRLRSFLFLAGALTLVWGNALLLIDVCGGNISQGIIRAVEDGTQKSYSPEDAVIVSSAVQQEPSSALRVFAAARLLERRGQDERAIRHYEVALQNTTDASLRRAAQNNLGAIAFRAGKFQEAREWFLKAETTGDTSRELYVNLSNVFSALVEPQNQRTYFDKLRTAYPDASVLSNEDSRTAYSEEPPVWLLYRELLRPIPDTLSVRHARQRNVSYALLRGSSPAVLIGVGIVAICFGIALLTSPQGRKFNYESYNIRPRATLLWAIFPFGTFAAGEKPLLAIFGISAFLSFVMLALDQPIRLYPVFSNELPMTSFWLFAAISLVMTSLAIAALQWRQLQNNSQLVNK